MAPAAELTHLDARGKLSRLAGLPLIGQNHKARLGGWAMWQSRGESSASAPVILVVEDEPVARDCLRDLLEQEGYLVEAAGDGVAGLERIDQGGIDLVLLDLMLPKMDGFELCRR